MITALRRTMARTLWAAAFVVSPDEALRITTTHVARADLSDAVSGQIGGKVTLGFKRPGDPGSGVRY